MTIQNNTQPHVTIGTQLDALASDLKGLLDAVSVQAKEFRQHREKEPASPMQVFIDKVATAIKTHPIPAIGMAIGLGAFAVLALRRAR
jgi:hypothetical protein